MLLNKYSIDLEKGEFEYVVMLIENMKDFYEKDLKDAKAKNDIEEIEFLEIEIEHVNYILEKLEYEKEINIL